MFHQGSPWHSSLKPRHDESKDPAQEIPSSCHTPSQGPTRKSQRKMLPPPAAAHHSQLQGCSLVINPCCTEVTAPTSKEQHTNRGQRGLATEENHWRSSSRPRPEMMNTTLAASAHRPCRILRICGEGPLWPEAPPPGDSVPS